MQVYTKVLDLPIKYRCKHCGRVLYEFKEVGQSYIGVPTPHEVVKLVGYVCPSCKKVLEAPGVNFKQFVVVKTFSSINYKARVQKTLTLHTSIINPSIENALPR